MTMATYDLSHQCTEGDNNVGTTAGNGSDLITANMLGGNDYFTGLSAAQYLVTGGTGNDTISSSRGGGTMHGDDGSDWIIAQLQTNGTTHIGYGDAGDDRLYA